MRNILIVGLGGFIGSVLRYLIGGLIQGYFKSGPFPWGTLGVNIAGCFVIGLLGGLSDSSGIFSSGTRLFIFLGVLGGFTTFSSFGYESLALLRDHETLLAFAYVSGHIFLGIGAAFLGYGITTLKG